MKRIFIYLIAALMFAGCGESENKYVNYMLPIAKDYEFTAGEFETDNVFIAIEAPGVDCGIIKEQLAELFPQDGGEKAVTLQIKDKVEGIESPEGYRLEITPEQLSIEATDGAGLFYAVQSLIQLKGDGNSLPCCTITDEPEFGYRGMMLDVSRHFFGKEFVKKQIDAMAHFKMNRLHLHLTDAAGWRIEIKKYPRLTQFAAWRNPALWKEWWFGDRKYVEEGSEGAYGGYFTQEDIRELVAYAAERYITIIPEIEMPAHSEEVLTAYPELSCTHEPYKQADFCVGNEATFEFLQNVLDEVIELFPSEYIHIGGDEAGKNSWPHCPLCQKRMKEENLKGVDELQSYLIQRIEKYLNSKGKQIIGWDEILDGGLAPNATVMSWRGTEGGIAAAESGHKAIMTPGQFCYLDSYQDAPPTEPMAFGPYMPLEKVYSYNPTNGLGEQQAAMIYGIQGNLWVEYVPTGDMVEYMLYPRILAIAEIGWSNPAQRCYNEFKERAIVAVNGLRAKGYNAFDLANEHGQRSEAATTLNHIAVGKKVSYADGAEYNEKYNAGGDSALTDGVRGGWTYTDSKWQGFIRRGGFDVTIDLESEREIKRISADFMQMPMPEVWLPGEVTISVSNDNVTFTQIAKIVNDTPTDVPMVIRNFGWEGSCTVRYIRYHAAKGPKGGWLFTDEIVVE